MKFFLVNINLHKNLIDSIQCCQKFSEKQESDVFVTLWIFLVRLVWLMKHILLRNWHNRSACVGASLWETTFRILSNYFEIWFNANFEQTICRSAFVMLRHIFYFKKYEIKIVSLDGRRARKKLIIS